MHFLHRVRLLNCHTMQRVFILGNGCWRHAVPSGIHLRFRARFFCDDDTTISTPYDVCITSLRANVCVIFLATRYNLITLVCQFGFLSLLFMTILAIASIVSFQFHTLYKVCQSFQFISRCSRVWMLCRYPALQSCCALQGSHSACHDCVCVMLYISTARITFCVQNPFASCVMMTIAHRTWPSLAMSLVS